MINEYYINDNISSGQLEKSFIKPYHIHLSLIILWAIFPILSIFAICVFLYTAKVAKPALFFYLFLLALVPALINGTKLPETDLEQYYTVFSEYYTLNITDATKTIILDPFFYYLTFILSHTTAGYTPAFVIFWTTFTYFVLFIALYEFNKIFESHSRKRLIGVIFFAIFIGLDFGLSGHLVRQCAALSLSMLAIARLCRGEKNYKIFFILAFLTHFSTLIFIPIILLLKLPPRYLLVSLLLFFLLAFKVGSYNILQLASHIPVVSSQVAVTVLDRADLYVDKDDGSITLRLIIEMFFYSCSTILFLIWGKQLFNPSTYISFRKYVVIFSSFLIFLILIRNNSLLLLRYFFYLYFLSLFVILILFKTKSYFAYCLFLFYIVTAPIRWERLLSSSSFTYISNSYEILFCSTWDFLSYKP